MTPRKLLSMKPALSFSRFPVLDFLAPSFAAQLNQQTARTISTTARCRSASTNNTKSGSENVKSWPKTQLKPQNKKPLSEAQREFLTRALRVNQAGELAATLIYTHQTPIVVKDHPNLRGLMKHMYDQEAGHFKTFNALLSKHRIRPTAMYPVWVAAASTLGWATALMGREAAMACTEAVEIEIGTHYNDQVRELLYMMEEMEKQGEDIGDDLRELVDNVRRIRDEELEHMDIAVDNDAKQAKPYEALTGIIRSGCRGAIWLTERV